VGGTERAVRDSDCQFSKEITTSVLWLNEHALDIRCVRLRPYALEARVLLDVQQVIPLPEADAYTVQLKKKAEETGKLSTLSSIFRNMISLSTGSLNFTSRNGGWSSKL
jgi:hypothetical protein